MPQFEWRWALPPLTARDASDDVGNLRDALDFAHADASVPDLPLPLPPIPMACPSGSIPSEPAFEGLGAQFLSR